MAVSVVAENEIIDWLAFHFDRCWQWLEPALRKPRQPYSKEFVWQKLFAGDAQLWPGPNSAVVTQIEVNPDGSKFLFGWIAGGKLEEINSLRADIEAWAKKQGCVKSYTIQRPGFRAKGKRLEGYRLTGVLMEKDL